MTTPKKKAAKKTGQEALLKEINTLVKKHKLAGEFHGIVFKNIAAEGDNVRAAEDECPPCPDGYECITLVHPTTGKKKKVCIKKTQW